MKPFICIAGLLPVFMFVVGLVFGYNAHPYETCSQRHASVEDISECVYLLTRG